MAYIFQFVIESVLDIGGSRTEAFSLDFPHQALESFIRLHTPYPHFGISYTSYLFYPELQFLPFLSSHSHLWSSHLSETQM